MNKKLMAVAVAGALAAPGLALAQASTVQIYGTIVAHWNYLDQGDGLKRTDMLNSHDSNLGFKGEEKLGGGLSAWFQCESTFDPTGGLGSWCGRNTGVGFKGAFGNIFLGNWDTPAKIVMGPPRPFSTSGAFGMGSLLWNESGSNVGNPTTTTVGGVTTVTGNAASFTRRQANLISYHSPTWNGFQVLGAWSTANEATGVTSAVLISKQRLWSLGASYSTGPLYLGAGYERHKDYNPGASTAYTGGDDTMWSIGAAYTFGPVKVSAIYVDIEYETGPGVSLDTKGFGIYADWRISGPHGLRLGYTKADDVKGTAGGPTVNSFAAPTGAGVTDSGAELWAIQYYYAFSKRTQLNIGYAKLDNDQRGRHRLQSLGARNTCQGFAGTLSISCSRDQDAIVIGVRHSF